MKNGPKTVGSVAPGGRRWFMPTTSIDSPRVSEARTNSWRLSSVMWPVRVRKSMAANHSSSVSWTSLAKACRWRTSDCMTSRSRGIGRAVEAGLDGPGQVGVGEVAPLCRGWLVGHPSTFARAARPVKCHCTVYALCLRRRRAMRRPAHPGRPRHDRRRPGRPRTSVGRAPACHASYARAASASAAAQAQRSGSSSSVAAKALVRTSSPVERRAWKQARRRSEDMSCRPACSRPLRARSAFTN